MKKEKKKKHTVSRNTDGRNINRNTVKISDKEIEVKKEIDFLNKELTEAIPHNATGVTDLSSLKEIMVSHVGNVLKPKDMNVTIDMIIKVLAIEFPEFLMAIAEENFIRGYTQCQTDLDVVSNEEKKKSFSF